MEIDDSKIHLAISMVEMDTDMVLTDEERNDMVERIKSRLKDVL
jgi:predicted ATP-dependent protease